MVNISAPLQSEIVNKPFNRIVSVLFPIADRTCWNDIFGNMLSIVTNWNEVIFLGVRGYFAAISAFIIKVVLRMLPYF